MFFILYLAGEVFSRQKQRGAAKITNGGGCFSKVKLLNQLDQCAVLSPHLTSNSILNLSSALSGLRCALSQEPCGVTDCLCAAARQSALGVGPPRIPRVCPLSVCLSGLSVCPSVTRTPATQPARINRAAVKSDRKSSARLTVAAYRLRPRLINA